VINAANANKIFFALLATGYPIGKIPLAMKQAALESAGYTSSLGVNSNNWTGIEKRAWEQGIADDGARFSHFNKISDWARAYRHIVEDIHPEISQATNVNDFGHAVYDSGYTVQEGASDDVDSYIAGMNKYSDSVDAFIQVKKMLFVHIGLVIFVALGLFIWKLATKK
jgi:uncharacterized FlgJ-related protein